MKTIKFLAFVIGSILYFSVNVCSQVTYSTPGIYSWTVPSCVTQITVHTYGAGGGGGGALAILRTANDNMEACASGGGGGGGGYSSATYTVVPGQVYTIVVGAGGVAGISGAGTWNGGITTPAGSGGSGGLSSFSGNGYNLQATGGTGGTGGSIYNNNSTTDHNSTSSGGIGGTGSGGTVNFAGGNGSSGYHGNFGVDKSGAGGGAAGPGGYGNNSIQNASVAATPGGIGQSPGGNGGNGRFHNTPNNGGDVGVGGFIYGGGGGGAVAHRGSSYGVQSYAGGAGANGAVLITYSTGTLPNPPLTQAFSACAGATVANLVATGTNILWYSSATSTVPLSASTVLTSGTYYATQTVGGCESNRTTATVTIISTPPPTMNSFQFCSNMTLTLADLPMVGTNISWFTSADMNTILADFTEVVFGQTYYAIQSANGCDSDPAPFTINATHTPAPTFVSPSVCEGNTMTLGDVSVTGTAIMWYNGMHGMAILPSTYVMVPGVTYYLEQTLNGCASERVPVTLTALPTPTADAGPDRTISCNVGQEIGNSASPITYNYSWSPTIGLSNPSIPNPSANPITSTVYTLTVMNPVNGCSNTDQVNVTVTSTSAPTFTQPVALCLGQTIALSSVQVTGTAIQWYSSASGGAPIPNSTIVSTNSTYYMTQTVDGCESERVAVNFSFNAATQAPWALPVYIYCSGENNTLEDLDVPNGQNLLWYDQPVGGNNLPSTTALTDGLTYYVSQTVGGCESSRTPITVEAVEFTAEFDEISPICIGETFTLPTTSTNGYVGSWSPAINNQVTTTYTFTPNNPCVAIASLTVVVNQEIVPEFGIIAPICIGQVFELPINSLNGISGTWSPSLNNQLTTTYTFTPNGSCVLPATLTVEVGNSIVPTFNNLDPICRGAELNLPNVSLNGIDGLWSPAVNNLATTTYTFTPNDDGCYSDATMTVVVEPAEIPVFDYLGPLCEGTEFTLPTTSINGLSGSWSPAIDVNNTTQYTFSVSGHACTVNTSMEVVILPILTNSFMPIGPVCQGSNFTLPLISQEGMHGVWTPAINNQETTTYTFVPFTSICTATATMTVEVLNGVQFIVSDSSSYCLGDSVPAFNITAIGGSGPYQFRVSLNEYPSKVFASAYPSIEISPYQLIGFAPNQAGCYDLHVSLVGQGPECSSGELFVENYICLVAPPNASFSASAITMDGFVTFSNLSTNATSYYWDFGDDFSSLLESPSHRYFNNDNFTVTLVAANEMGCIDSSQLIIRHNEEVIFYVPNAFTPDGDEFNQTFKPIISSGIDIYSYQMDIYNRWGEVIFTSKDVNVGWDGTYNGMEVQDGIYTWKIHFKTKHNDERHEHVGHVTRLK